MLAALEVLRSHYDGRYGVTHYAICARPPPCSYGSLESVLTLAVPLLCTHRNAKPWDTLVNLALPGGARVRPPPSPPTHNTGVGGFVLCGFGELA